MFSIAYVISPIFNVFPCGLVFDIKLIRKHLLQLYNTCTLRMFPVSKNHFYNNLFISNDTPLIRNIIYNHQFFTFPVILRFLNKIKLIILLANNIYCFDDIMLLKKIY